VPNLSGLPIHQTPLMLKIALTARETRPALRKVCDFLLRYPLSSATLTIDTIARRAESSTAAVNRLANAMGMNGFTGLHNALVDNLLGMLAPQEHIATEILRRPRTRFCIEQQVNLTRSNLDGVVNLNCNEIFDRVVDQLVAAPHVYIVGFGSSFYLAGLAAASLSTVCATATALNVEGGAEVAAYRLATVAPGDVLLAIALPPYSSDTMMLAQWARSRGATVHGITDSPASPLCEIAHSTLFAPPIHPILPNSKVGVLTLLEAIIATVSQASAPAIENKRLAIDQLMQRNRSLSALGTPVQQSSLDKAIA